MHGCLSGRGECTEPLGRPTSGRLLLTSDDARATFSKFDNLGRVVAAGLFSSDASITPLSDDPTTETSNRVALATYTYDQQGRVYKSERYAINQSTGAIVQSGGVDQTLETLNWFDAAGRLIKRRGETFQKFAYDRFGRRTHAFMISSSDDSGYGDADDVAGDIVLEEHQSVYNAAGRITCTRVVSACLRSRLLSSAMNRAEFFRSPLTHIRRSVRASRAIAMYRLTFLPGVITTHWVPGSIQSRPILRLRSTSTRAPTRTHPPAPARRSCGCIHCSGSAGQ